MAGVSDKTVQRYKKVLQDAPQDIVAQVHFRISLRETLNIPRRDAVCRRKKFAKDNLEIEVAGDK